MMTWDPEIEEINRRRALAREMGGPDRVAQQHTLGKLTVRERIEELVDSGSFLERGILGGVGTYDEEENLVDFVPKSTVFGIAKIDERPVSVTGQDFTARPGSGSTGATGTTVTGGPRTISAEHISHEMKIPFIRLIDGFGADIRAVGQKNRTYIPNGNWKLEHELLSEVPIVAAALGAVAGLPAAWVPASHFSIMIKGKTQVFAAGPPVVKRAIGLDIPKEDLGGFRQHSRTSGVVNNEAEDEIDALQQIRRFLSYLPTNVWELPPFGEINDPRDRRAHELRSIIPRDRNRGYNPRELISFVMDEDSTFELSRYYGGSQITMFARLNGRPVGVIANDPMVHGGAQDAPAARKIEKFVDTCDTFHLPIINFSDQPGFMIGPAAEAAGTLRAGVRTAVAIGQATVPWATVIVRRVYGVAGGARQDNSHFNFQLAWPSGEWGSLPIEGGIAAAYRREIEAADDPEAYRQELEEKLIAIRAPWRTAEDLDVEDIIDPADTRPMLSDWLDVAYKANERLVGPKSRGMRP